MTDIQARNGCESSADFLAKQTGGLITSPIRKSLAIRLAHCFIQ